MTIYDEPTKGMIDVRRHIERYTKRYDPKHKRVRGTHRGSTRLFGSFGVVAMFSGLLGSI